MPDNTPTPGPYELFVLLLSVFALILVAGRVTVAADSEQGRIVDLADNAVCVFFMFDFVRNLIRAESRLRYLYTWGWVDLAAAAPAVDVLRFGRLGRIIRLLRVLRIIKAGRIITLAVTERRRESAVWGVALVAMLVVFGAAIAMLEFESRGGGANIVSAEDAVWWAMSTVTTVGYGDRYPVTSEGRLIAAVVMVVGVAVFTTLTGAAASWFNEGLNTRPRGRIALKGADGTADSPRHYSSAGGAD